MCIINHMDIKGRILQSLRRRKDGILLRSDVTMFGSRSQVSAALLHLCASGSIKRLERGVYVLPAKLAALGIESLLKKAHQRLAEARLQRALTGRRTTRITATARYVSTLAKQRGVIYKPTFGDRWANAVTRLAGDEITHDATDDLLVALAREGTLSPDEMVKLVMSHHRALKSNV